MLPCIKLTVFVFFLSSGISISIQSSQHSARTADGQHLGLDLSVLKGLVQQYYTSSIENRTNLHNYSSAKKCDLAFCHSNHHIYLLPTPNFPPGYSQPFLPTRVTNLKLYHPTFHLFDIFRFQPVSGLIKGWNSPICMYNMSLGISPDLDQKLQTND